jgi:hypothetical protein
MLIKKLLFLFFLSITKNIASPLFTKENIANTADSELSDVLNNKVFPLLQIKICDVNMNQKKEYQEVLSLIESCMANHFKPNFINFLKALKASSNKFQKFLDDYVEIEDFVKTLIPLSQNN